MEKKNIINELAKIFWIFMIGSVIGYIFETIVVIFQKGHFEIRQGVIYGPLIPVYGIGGIIYYITFNFVKTQDKGRIFLISMILRRSNRIFMFIYSRKSISYNIMGLFIFTNKL